MTTILTGLLCLLLQDGISPEAEEYFRKGESMIGTPDEFSAEQVNSFLKALELAPAFTAARYNLAIIYRHRGETAMALSQLEQLILMEPAEARFRSFKGFLLAEKGDHREAARSFEKALELDPTDFRSWEELGNIRYQEGAFADAETALLQAIRLNPSSTTAYFALGLCHHRLGRNAQAIENLERYLALVPDDFDALLLQGRLLVAAGEKQKGLARFQAASRIRPNDLDLDQDLGSLLMDLGDPAAAARHLGKPGQYSLEEEANLGILAQQQGRLDEAATRFRKVLEKDAGNALAWAYLGDILAGQGKSKEAIEAYRNALRINSSDFDTLLNLGSLLANQSTAVIAAHRAAPPPPQAKRPGDSPEPAPVPPEAVVLLQESFEVFSRAAEVRPESGEPHFNMAIILERTGQPEEARGHYLKALELGADNAQLRYRLAALYAQSGESGPALVHLRAAFEQEPEKYVPLVLDLLKSVHGELDGIRYSPEFKRLLDEFRR